MEISELINPLRRWWWLILIATLIATGSSYWVTSQQPPAYQSTATLMIGRTIDNPNPTSGQFNLEEQLATSYANIANREPLREATKDALGMDWLPEYSVSALPNTQLIEIVVVDTDPLRAQAVAQEIANQMISHSPTEENQEDLERQAFINLQLDTLQEQITDTQAEIEDLTYQLGELDSAREISDTQLQIASLQNKLSSLQSNYANLLAQTGKGAINTLTIIEQPTLPTRPIGSQKLLTVGLSAAVGFSIAAGAAYLLEYLDKSIKTTDEVKKLFNAPILGYIPVFPKKKNKWLFVSENPRSPIADNFRNLRINTDTIAPELKTLLITSSTIAEGKSSVAMNFAQISAQANRKVVLVDGDLRKSGLNQVLNIPPEKGLSNLLAGQSKLEDEIVKLNGGLIVLPSGKYPPNPTELLGSEKMTQLLSRLRETVDLVIVDSPPLFISDTVELISKVDGVIVVVQLEKTRKNDIREMNEQLQRLNTKVIGIVINKVDRHLNYYSGNYTNYYRAPEAKKKSKIAKTNLAYGNVNK